MPTLRVTPSPVDLAAQTPVSLQAANTAEEVTSTRLYTLPARTLAHAIRKEDRAHYSSVTGAISTDTDFSALPC